MNKLAPIDLARMANVEHRKVTNGLSEAADALENIKEKELWRWLGCSSFSGYCKSIGRTYSWGYKLIRSGEVQKSIPESVLPNQAAALAMSKIPLPQRKQVIQSVMDSGEKLTAQSIKSAVPLPNRVQIKDGTGFPVPQEIAATWLRAKDASEEIAESISKVMKLLEKANENRDPLFAEIDYQADMAKLSMLRQDLKTIKPHAVCLDCNGLMRESCKVCNGRGFISQFFYEYKIPQNKKDIREG